MSVCERDVDITVHQNIKPTIITVHESEKTERKNKSVEL
jgi:hypothetical protein